MATRKVVRSFGARHVAVATVHPQVGEVDRGRIYTLSSAGDWIGAWLVIDHDGTVVAELVGGDYLDAETTLLDATAALDEPVPLTELIGEGA